MKSSTAGRSTAWAMRPPAMACGDTVRVAPARSSLGTVASSSARDTIGSVGTQQTRGHRDEDVVGVGAGDRDQRAGALDARATQVASAVASPSTA